METLVIWKAFNEENKKLIRLGRVLVFLEHLDVQILKISQNFGVGVGVDVGFTDLPVCPILYIYMKYIYIYIYTHIHIHIHIHIFIYINYG